MKWLAFAAALPARSDRARRKQLRQARFESRSSLPISAACVVGNGVRETLSSLMGAPVVLRLLEPVIPAPEAWQAITAGSRLFRIRGNVADAAVLLRPSDAIALVTALFGEPHAGNGERALSPIECDVLDRTISALASNLTAVCGTREPHFVERVGAIAGFFSYFELLIEEPLSARIGIALSRDPSPERGAALEAAHLAGVKLITVATVEIGKVEASAVTRMGIGAVIPIAPVVFQRCALTSYGRRIARGECGVRNGRFAFSVDASPATM